jgi:multiple sugar transport system substrate-binding protein
MFRLQIFSSVFGLGLTVLFCSTYLTGCVGEDDNRTVLRYARWGLPEEITAERELLKEFEAANPDIRVDVEFNSWSEYWNKLQAQMAAGAAPDVFLMGGTYIHDYVKRDQIENLAPYIKDDADLNLDNYFAETVNVYTFNNGMWSLPRDCNTIGIYYNKKLFDDNNVSYPEEDWTWGDFHEKAKALSIDENNDGRMESYGYLASFESMEVHWISWVWQNGGEVLDNAHVRCLLAEPAAIEALTFFTNLVIKDGISPDTAQASTFGSNMFLTGRLAMSSEGSWMVRLFSEIENFEWGIAPLPQGKRQVAPVNGLGNAVYAKAKNKDAAWRLVKFLSSETYQKQLAKSGTSIPALKSVAYSPAYLDDNPPNKKIFLKQIENGRTLPFTPGFARWEDAIRKQLELVWLGQKDVATAMAEATTQVEEIIAKSTKELQ